VLLRIARKVADGLGVTALVRRVLAGLEPVLLVTVAMEGLHFYQAQTSGGIGVEDAAAATVIFVLGVLGRQLVYPAAAIENERTTFYVRESLGEPITGLEEED
jgi:hypothetical protein